MKKHIVLLYLLIHGTVVLAQPSFVPDQEIRKMGTVDPQPNHNWKFVPEDWVKPALERDRKILFGK